MKYIVSTRIALFTRFAIIFWLVLGCGWGLASQALAQQDARLPLHWLLRKVIIYESLGRLENLQQILAQGIELATNANDQALLAYFMGRKATALQSRGSTRAALKLIDKAIDTTRRLGNDRLLAFSLSDKRQIFHEQEAPQKSLEAILATHEIFKRHDERKNLAVLYSHIGRVDFSLGPYTKAVDFHHKSTPLLLQGASRELGLAKLNIGLALTKANQYEPLEHTLEEAGEIFSAEKVADNLALADNWLGDLNTQQGKWSEAIARFQFALDYFTRTNSPPIAFNCHAKLARLYLEKGDTANANEQLAAAKKLAKLLGTPAAHQTINRIEAQLAAAELDFARAHRQHQKTLEQVGKMQADDSNDKIERLRVQFETAQKEAENALLKEQNKVQALLISSNRAQRNLALVIGGLVILLLLVTFLAFLQQRRWHRQMAKLALEDELTGAANRRRIMQLLEDVFARAQRYPQSGFAVALLDLDHFKQINDQYGHDAGDEVLRAFVRTGQQVIRKQDVLGRYGGEEWLLLLPNTTAEAAREVVERMRMAFKQAIVPGLPPEYPLSFSAGLTQYRQGDTSVDQLLQRADAAMYKAKTNGRDRLEFAP